MIVVMLTKQVDPEMLGFVPGWLDETDPRPAKVQLNEKYQHGGGWRPQDGFKLLRPSLALKYPDDPPMKPFAMMKMRDEVICMYDYGYVAIIQPDKSFEACRMD